MPSAVCRALIAALCLLLAAFFGFVGWNKAFAAPDDLARYGSWTVYLPQMLGRMVGWSEILCAGALLAGLTRKGPMVATCAALALLLNQMAAAIVHSLHHETAALPQNGVLMALLLGLARLTHIQRETL